MVAAQKEKILRIFNFERKQQANGCYRKVAPVNVVAQKKVVGLWWVSSNIEVVHEVLKLSVDVPQNIDGRHQFQQNGLFL